MRKTASVLITTALLLILSACEDVNFGKFFYTDCDVDTRFEQSINRNMQQEENMLFAADDKYGFWVCSDLHLKKEIPPYLEHFFEQVNSSSNELFIVYNGDLYNGDADEADFTYNTLQKQSPLPAFYTAGNHDLFFDWNIYYDRFGSSTYTLEIKTPTATDLLLFLESASATLGKKQYDWLCDVLRKRKSYRHCFVITHTNFSQQGINNGIFMSDEMHTLYRLFGDHQVTAVFSGHAHQCNDQTRLGVRYLTTGALKNGEYGLVTIDNDKWEWEFK